MDYILEAECLNGQDGKPPIVTVTVRCDCCGDIWTITEQDLDRYFFDCPRCLHSIYIKPRLFEFGT